MDSRKTYSYSAWAIWLCLLCSLPLAWLYSWHDADAVNMLDGDARYYYYYLQSSFIDPALANYDWLKQATPVTHHPVGLDILWLPFFLVAHVSAQLFHYPLSGLSLPYQASIALAGLTYGILGLVYLRKLLKLNAVSDNVTALIIPLIFLGTNLLHYTLHEAGMSHVYSFFLITAFMYYSCRFVKESRKSDLLLAAVFFGLVLLVRLNNVFVIFTLFFWFSNRKECFNFFNRLIRNRAFYSSIAVLLALLCIQPLIWLWKEDVLFVNRYASYGFYWTNPAFFKMLFGFNAGFFIYAPLCLLFLAGLTALYKTNRFSFYSATLFVLLLFYFFSAYSAYTYYDGIGIRVLIDYYAVFAVFGAKLFSAFESNKAMLISLSTLSFALLAINLVYAYQSSHRIILRSGMTYSQWKYTFMRTGSRYENCLGGSNDLLPFSKNPVPASLSGEAVTSAPFDFSNKEFGPSLMFDRIGFISRRICMKLKIKRTEAFANSSRDAWVCAVVEDQAGNRKGYQQFRLNETPSQSCCEEAEYNYTSTMEGDFKASDRLSVALWNLKKQPFLINTFSATIYNYNYQ